MHLNRESKRKISLVIVPAVYLLFGALAVLSQDVSPAITNSDVIEMLNAGLDENTIILAIRQSDPKFDTTAKALIELKKLGVGSKVLDAMLQRQSKASSISESDDGILLSCEPSRPDCSKGVVSREVVMIDGEERVPLKRSQPKILYKSGLFLVFGKIRTKYTLEGIHAQLRVGDTTPEFELSLPSDVNATQLLVLIKFRQKSERREVEVSRTSIAKTSNGFRKEVIVPTTFKEISTSTNPEGIKYTLYRVSVLNPLKPGEYAFVPRSTYRDYYDFGIDSGSK